MDLYGRRPEDRQFKMAHRLRLADTSVGALLSALQAQLQASQPAGRPEPSAAPRNTTPDKGWTLPEP